MPLVSAAAEGRGWGRATENEAGDSGRSQKLRAPDPLGRYEVSEATRVRSWWWRLYDGWPGEMRAEGDTWQGRYGGHTTGTLTATANFFPNYSGRRNRAQAAHFNYLEVRLSPAITITES